MSLYEFDKQGNPVLKETNESDKPKVHSFPNNLIGNVAKSLCKAANDGRSAALTVSEYNVFIRRASEPVNVALETKGMAPIPATVGKKSGKVSYRQLAELAVANPIAFTRQSLLAAAKKVK